jgi:hypothetical protein
MATAFSPGDAVIALGAVVFLVTAMRTLPSARTTTVEPALRPVPR